MKMPWLVLGVSFCFLSAPAYSAEPAFYVALLNAQGQEVGAAHLTQIKGGVAIEVSAYGLPPGKKGIHIHETGKCDPPDFKSAGGHYNPGKHQHGTLNPKGAHLGGLPNLEIAADGKGALEFLVKGASLTGGRNFLRKEGGTALVIHAGPDDLKTDPAGGSGERIACGVITAR